MIQPIIFINIKITKVFYSNYFIKLDLIFHDKDRLNLFGTGELKGFESEYID